MTNKTRVSIVCLFIVVIVTKSNVAVAAPPSTRPPTSTRMLCRSYVGMSKCVESPLYTEQDQPWCPYHVCGASYVPGRRCPDGEGQATHECDVVIVQHKMYRCIDDFSKIVKLPLNCEETVDENGEDECTTEISVCRCEETHPKRPLLTPYRALNISCGNANQGLSW